MGHVRRCLLPLLLLLFLAGCGGVSDLVGTYKLEHLDVGAGTVDMAELSDAAQAAGIDFQATLALEEDGTFSLEVTAADGDSSLEGTWSEEDGGIVLTAGESTIRGVRTEGTLVFTVGQQSMTFAPAVPTQP